MNKLSLSSLILLAVLVSCQKRFAIEDRAIKQIAVSMEDELESYFPGKVDWYIEGLKTVYANDSICILQCTARFRDAQNEKKMRDYRYIYLLDKGISMLEGKPVFMEEFRNVLCMPDDLIKRSRKEVKKNKENVYESFRAGGLPVRKPFDAGQY